MHCKSGACYETVLLHMRRSEDAVESDELANFLRLNESCDAEVEGDRPPLPQVPVGVPGAASPAQMTPEHHKPATFPLSSTDSPLRGKPSNKREGEFDVSTELEGYGLQGVRVTQDDLAALVEELGLGGDEADELVKGLIGPEIHKKEEKVSDPNAEIMAEPSAKVKASAKPTPTKAKPSLQSTAAGTETKRPDDIKKSKDAKAAK